MCKFGYDEIILLNNFIYLEWSAEDDTKLYDLVKYILENDNLNIIMDKMPNCIGVITIDEWREILFLLLKNDNLKDVVIRGLEDSKTGMRAACFIDNEDVLVVFRGTTTIKEWDDNGQGAYEYDTEQQKYALNYVNNLKYNSVIVTGHSKGGNKAQYITVRSPKVEKCFSINGQGFSNEFLKKYGESIKDNKYKIIAINSKYDYVSCLLNPIFGEAHYIKTSFQKNPIMYHKANILINKDGHICEEVKQGIFSKMINAFSTSLISDLPKEIKELTVDGLISGIESVMCKENNAENIIKGISGVLVLLAYGRYFSIKETLAITFTLMEILLIPLFLCNDIIDADEKNSEYLRNTIIEKCDELSHAFLKKLKIIDNGKYGISKKVEKEIDKFIVKLNSVVSE